MWEIKAYKLFLMPMEQIRNIDEQFQALLCFVVLIDGGAVSWILKKQELVKLLTMEAEYVAAIHTAKELLWL